MILATFFSMLSALCTTSFNVISSYKTDADYVDYQNIKVEKEQWLKKTADMQSLLVALKLLAQQNRELVALCLKQSEQCLSKERNSYDQLKEVVHMLEKKQ